MKQFLFVFAFASLAVQLRATEPVEVDVTQMTVAGNGGIIDYLVPVDHAVLQFYPVPQFYYLAQFI